MDVDHLCGHSPIDAPLGGSIVSTSLIFHVRCSSMIRARDRALDDVVALTIETESRYLRHRLHGTREFGEFVCSTQELRLQVSISVWRDRYSAAAYFR